jgi:putative hydroxymethylpyrimidine transport system ATP-binding protein
MSICSGRLRITRKCGQPMSEPVLQFEALSFTYTGESLLNGLDFAIYEGEFVSIIGPSGSGKSTLFRLITGLEEPNNGSVHLNGKVEKNRLGKVGYMPQQDLLMPWRTIIDNAALPLELKGVNKEKAYEQVTDLLEEFGLKGVEKSYPDDLSGGMKQRVSFLRSVLSGSNLLLLDEPFSALDAITRLSMQEWLIEQWKKWRKTIVFITHDVDEALFLSDRIFVLREKPISKLYEVKVPLDRPRSVRDLSNPSVVELKEDLINQLRTREKR